MASKRGAGSELTDRNWDQEEEPEEAGSFKQANDAALKGRVIKTAKRRGTSLGAGGSSAFSGFSGFGGSAAVSKPSVNFSFGGASSTTPSAADKPVVNFSFGGLASSSAPKDEEPPKKPSVNFSFGSIAPASSSSDESSALINAKSDATSAGAASSSSSSLAESKKEEPSSSSATSTSDESKSTASEAKSLDKAKTERKYLAHVKTLNKSVLAWIQKHVEDRPTCILSPVFEDYERHLKRIEERFGVVPSDNEDSESEAANNMAAVDEQEKADTNGSKHDTATSNGIYSDQPGDKEDCYSATKTRFTSTTPSQSNARGLDASLKEIDSKDRKEKKEDKDGEEPKLNHFASFSAINTNHTFSFSNLSHARAPTSSCNSSMKPTFSFCVSSSADNRSETFTTSTTAAAAEAAAGAEKGGAPTNGASLFSFGSGGSSLGGSGGIFASSAPSSTTETNKGIFSFGSSTSTATSSTPSFTFGSGGGGMFGGSSSTGLFGGSGAAGTSGGAFSFGSTSAATTFTGFGSSVAAASQSGAGSGDAAAGGGDGDEDYVPPKPEVQEISEDDAVFTKRCKLFYKKEEAFVDRGVGNLFIKPLSSSEDEEKKFSLLVRADTNLGNILLNISLSSLKFSKMGAKDISFLCVPNPLPDPKMEADTPVIMLLRVKDTTLRDEVLEQLTSHA